MANITRVISCPLSLLQEQRNKVGFGFRLADQIPAVSATSFVTLGKLLKLSEPQFLQL